MGGNGSGRHGSRDTRAEHGSRQRYARGCHCARCRGAWADYIRQRRARLGHKRKAPFYPGRVEHTAPPRLTPLGREILEALQEREGRSGGEIFEHLLRLHGGTLRFSDAPADEATAA